MNRCHGARAVAAAPRHSCSEHFVGYVDGHTSDERPGISEKSSGLKVTKVARGAPEHELRSSGRAAFAASSQRLRQFPRYSLQDICRQALTRHEGPPASLLRCSNWVRFAKYLVSLYNLKLYNDRHATRQPIGELRWVDALRQ